MAVKTGWARRHLGPGRPPAHRRGAAELEAEAHNFRRLIIEPGPGRQVAEGMAVAIDGEIYQDAYLAAFNPDSEIYLIPKIGGG